MLRKDCLMTPIPELNPAQVYIDALPSPTSRKSMKGALKIVAKTLGGGDDPYTFDWTSVRYSHSMYARAQFAKKYAPQTTNRLLVALRRVLETTWRMGLMSSEDYHRASDVKDVASSDALFGRMIDPDEFERMCAVCRNGTKAGKRDLAILHILRYAGLRRDELVGVNVADFDSEDKSLRVHKGKGAQRRVVYLPNKAIAAVSDWLLVLGGKPSDPMFVGVKKNDEPARERISGMGIYNIINKCAALAGTGEVHPHDFRRTYISDLFDKGVDISTISKLAGHNKSDHTVGYDRRKEDPKRRAAELYDDEE